MLGEVIDSSKRVGSNIQFNFLSPNSRKSVLPEKGLLECSALSEEFRRRQHACNLNTNSCTVVGSAPTHFYVMSEFSSFVPTERRRHKGDR